MGSYDTIGFDGHRESRRESAQKKTPKENESDKNRICRIEK